MITNKVFGELIILISCIKKSFLRSKTLLVIIFSPPEIGHACLLSDANDFYIEQGVHFTMKKHFS